MLSKSFEDKPKILDNIKSTVKVPKQAKRIVTPIDPDVMMNEVEGLRQKDCRLLVSKNYEVYLASAKDMPNVLREIGRLREITFREVANSIPGGVYSRQVVLLVHFRPGAGQTLSTEKMGRRVVRQTNGSIKLLSVRLW